VVVVTGATGFVGGAIVTDLAGSGHAVRALTRGEADGRRGPNISWTRVAGWTRGELGGALTGARVVVHCASLVHRPGAPPDAYRRFNVDGTRVLLEASASAGVASVVFLSSIKVYGEHTEGVLDEETKLAPEGPYATSKVDAEGLTREAAKREGMRATILRLCPVYGPGDRGNVRAMIQAISRRRFFVPGDGSVRKSIVHVSTVAEVARAVVENDAARGTYVVADREAPSMRELSGTIARAVGRRPPPAVPAPIVYAGASSVERVFGLVGRAPPVTRDLVRKALQPTVCSPARVEAELGVRCHVDLATAIREEVAWLRSDGSLR
jgi:UDP-glucose 4-epimerase